MNKVTRYNPKIRGSFCTFLCFYDWELSITISAIAKEIKRVETSEDKANKKGYLTYLKKLRRKYGEALGQVLKAELRDLKLKKGQKELGEA